MTCLLWCFNNDSGCLDFDDKQIIGRDIFPGSPQSIPKVFFEVYQQNGVWFAWLNHSKDMQWWPLAIRNPSGEWQLAGDNPIAIEDGSLFKLGDAEDAPKMQFRCNFCTDITTIPTLWESKIWKVAIVDAVTAPMEPSLLDAPSPVRAVASSIEWLAWFLEKYRLWAALSITLLVIGWLTVKPAVNLPNLLPLEQSNDE